MTNPHFRRRLIFLFIILAMAMLGAIFTGSVNIPFQKLFFEENRIILNLRVFRVLTAIIAGIGLSVCGIVLQAILRNPLAEPYLLGTSSGAGVGAVIAILFGLSRIYLPLAAFIGAILTICVVYVIARQGNKIPEQTLILAGIIVSIAFSAIMVFLISISGNEALHEITWWLWGNLQIYDTKLLFFVTATVLIGVTVIFIFSRDLNAISSGEEEAVHLGIDIEKVKKILLLVTALITASLVCVCGIIGFVGLIIPHMMRLIFGTNHKLLIPTTCLAASIFMVFCDMLSRVLFPPFEIPIGVITAILGCPTFVILLKKGKKQRYG